MMTPGEVLLLAICVVEWLTMLALSVHFSKRLDEKEDKKGGRK